MASSDEVKGLFPAMAERLIPEKAAGVNTTILFDLSGDNGGLYWLKIADGVASAGEGEAPDPAMTVKASADDWFAVATGQMNAMQAFMTGKLKSLVIWVGDENADNVRAIARVDGLEIFIKIQAKRCGIQAEAGGIQCLVDRCRDVFIRFVFLKSRENLKGASSADFPKRPYRHHLNILVFAQRKFADSLHRICNLNMTASPNGLVNIFVIVTVQHIQELVPPDLVAGSSHREKRADTEFVVSVGVGS